MRTFILLLVCVGIGYGIAITQFQYQTSGIKNVLGMEVDMDTAIRKAKSTESKPGKIEVVGGSELDFGTMRLGTKRSHSFVFRNVGEAPVDVVYKTSSCKCTVGKLDSKTLNPGEQTEVNLEWLAEGVFSDFAQTATIGTSAPDQEEIKLTIKGKISQAYVFEPSTIDFRDFLATEEYEMKGRVYSFEEGMIQLTSASWSDAQNASKIVCEMEEPKKLEPGEIAEYSDSHSYVNFKIKLKKGIPAGVLSGNMVFTKKSEQPDAKEQQISLPIQGRSVSPIRVIAGNDFNEERNIFDLGSAKSSVGLKKSLVLSIKDENASDIQVKLESIPSSAEGKLKVTVAELKSSQKQKMFSVTLEVAPGTAPVEFAGAYGKDFAKIVLETNMESAPKFPMYIKFRITE